MAEDTNNKPTTQTSGNDLAKQREEKEQKKKLEIAKNANYVVNSFMNEQLALIDEKVEEKTKFGMKIVTFFVPKFNKGKDFYDAKNAVSIPYSSLVKEIVLEDTLDSIGLQGYIDVSNEGGVLDGILERHNLFYLVINMTEYFGNGTSVKYEPYIFEIDRVNQVSKPFNTGSRVIRFHLVDIITAILRSHSIASFIKLTDEKVTSCDNYKKLFNNIIDYVKRFIKINFDNSLEFKKDVFFGETTMYKGKEKLNGYDKDLSLGGEKSLIRCSFNKIDKNASIWEAMNVLLRDCVTSIKMSDELKQVFQDVGNVLIPFFFKEEYSDFRGVYNNFWREPEDKDTETQASTGSATSGSSGTQSGGSSTVAPQPTTPTNPSTPATVADETESTQPKTGEDSLAEQVRDNVSQDVSVGSSQTTGGSETPKPKDALPYQKELVNTQYGGKSDALVYRGITMRDFLMPFHLCFSQTVPIVFQEINVGKSQVISIEPPITDTLQSLQFSTIDKRHVDKRWKNAIFVDTVNSGCNSTIVFFDWFYRFFLRVFLNSSKIGGTKNFISNVIPDFYLFSLLNGVGYAENSNTETFNGLFDEYNSYTVVLKTSDTTNEALREMGKNLASLVLLNDTYSLSLIGNIRRRPNEIIKINVGDLTQGQESQIPLYTNLNQDSSIFIYVRKVTHVFKGDEYINKIVASKICESF